MERPVFIHPKALKALQNFPRTTRLSIGKAIRELQKGYVLSMPVSRHMPSVALGVSEIRVKDRSGAFRVFYYLKNAQGILVFHAFMKRDRKSPVSEVALARQRLREMLNEKD
jgi:phage-related protein